MNINFLWTDSIWLEDTKGWFVLGGYNALFEIDFEKKEYYMLDKLPTERIRGFRLNPRCVKFGQYLYCLPDFESAICVYDFERKKWIKIDISNLDNQRLAVVYLGVFETRLLIFSYGLQTLFWLDTKNNSLQVVVNLLDATDQRITHIIQEGQRVYGVSNHGVIAYDLRTLDVYLYRIKNMPEELTRICFDNEKFWFAGKRREIYVWKRGNDFVDVISDFPENFGIYCEKESGEILVDTVKEEYKVSAFLELMCIKDKIWCIPFQTNEILCMNRDMDSITSFIIEEEAVTSEGLWKKYSLNHKYLCVYVKENRYIGLYSLKNDSILQIDTDENSYEYINFKYNSTMTYIDSPLFESGDKVSEWIFERGIQNSLKEVKEKENIGKKIWNLTL